jgi:hypothetical protein
MPPETPFKQGDLRGHSDAHRCCGKVVDGKYVGAFRCELVRAAGFNFQACSFSVRTSVPVIPPGRSASAGATVAAQLKSGHSARNATVQETAVQGT